MARNVPANDFAPLIAVQLEKGSRISLGQAGSSIYRAEEFRPVLVFGPQRSGKTTAVVIPAILEWEGPALVTSVRLDVWKETKRRRSTMGRVYVYDPTGELASEVPEAVGWSPLNGVTSWDSAVSRAAGLCEGADAQNLRDSDFWITKARQLLAPLIFATAVAGGPFRHVVELLSVPRALLFDTVESQLSEPRAWAPQDREIEICLNRLEAAITMPDDTWGSVIATAGQVLQVFDYLGVERSSTTKGFHVDEFLDGGSHTLYLCAPATQQRMFRPLFTALAREVIDSAYRNNEAVNSHRIPLLICLDEAGNIARLQDLDVIATTAAGTGLQLVTVFHDMSQLQSCYGPDRASLIVNNHSGLLCLPGNRDPSTNSLLTSLLVDVSVRGLTHRGWNFSDLRGMNSRMALLLYGSMPAALIEQRRWYEDDLLHAQGGNEFDIHAGTGTPGSPQP